MVMMMNKRKQSFDFEQDDVDFDVTLSSPATKIRRLDAGDVAVPPVREEVLEEAMPMDPGLSNGFSTDSGLGDSGSGLNDERAIVLYKPVNNQQVVISSPNNFSFHSDFISNFRDHFFKPRDSSVVIKSLDEEEEEEALSSEQRNQAVIPWVPSHFNVAPSVDVAQEDAMEAEEDGVATMDIEDGPVNSNATPSVQENGFDFTRQNQGFPQWQQQHCLIPNLSYNLSTPISWLNQ